MGVLTQDMRDILASAMLAFVATVRRDGSPSLSPKASTIPYDDDHLRDQTPTDTPTRARVGRIPDQ